MGTDGILTGGDGWSKRRFANRPGLVKHPAERRDAMIDFEIGEDAALLQDVVERFAGDVLRQRARQAETDRGPDETARRVYESLGLMGLEFRGDGLGMVARCLVNEILGGADPGAALCLDRIGAAGYALVALDGVEGVDALIADPTRRAWLVTPEDGAINVTERAASGTLHFAPSGVTDLLVLSPMGVALIQSGIEETPVRGAGLRALDPARLTLHDAPVARFARVAIAPILARARLYTASLLLGVLEAASSYARAYARERVAFGRPIAHHQGLTFLLTDMNTAVAGARLLLQEAAWRLDAGFDGAEAAATAFTETVEQSAFVGPNAVQVLGGVGFMQDYPVEKHMREARALGLLLGGIDRARDDAMQQPSTALMAQGGL
jgi:alkylation response protein AidB-like acyl-CoA dehydrogenase